MYFIEIILFYLFDIVTVVLFCYFVAAPIGSDTQQQEAEASKAHNPSQREKSCRCCFADWHITFSFCQG